MKARTLLLLLFLSSFLNGSAALQESGKSIVLKKSTTSDGVLRSANLFVSAYLDISNELLLLNFEGCPNDVSISVTNLSTDEIIRTLKVDNVDLVSTNDSDAILFDKANKVKIVIKTENNVTIVKFYY